MIAIGSSSVERLRRALPTDAAPVCAKPPPVQFLSEADRFSACTMALKRYSTGGATLQAILALLISFQFACGSDKEAAPDE